MTEKKDALLAAMNALPGKDDKLKFIIDKGKAMEAMPDKFKIDQFLVKGCISRAWLFPQLKGDKVTFFADSEAFIVKGIIALLLEIYNDSSPADILTEDGSFLLEAGVTQHLSTNRRNGLSNVLNMIQSYAAAFQKTNQETLS